MPNNRKLTLIFLFAILFAFAPQDSHAQTSCGDVNPATATAIDCTSATEDAALNISAGVPSVVTNNPVVTVNSTAGSATLTSYGANVTTTQTGGDTVVIGGATDATFRTDDESYTTKSGSDGNVVTITAGTGDVDIDIHNISRVKIGGTGGNGIIATSASGSVNVNLSTGGLLLSDQNGTNGLIANTTSGSIDLTLAGENTFIHMITYRAKRDELSDTRGATLTSTSGAITVEITDSAAIIASSVGASYGLAAETGGSAGIDITVANAVSCIVGKDGIIANTVSGNIDLALANGVVYGRGGKGETREGGNGIIATSTSGGDINIGGNGGSVLWADEAGSIAIEASTTGILSVVAGEDNGLSVWTEGGFAAINASTVNVVGADIGGNDSDFAILATGDVDVSGADVWTNKTGAATISATTGAVNVWNASKVRATGATANAISATTVVVNGSEVWTEGDTSNSIVTETLNVSGGGKVWANGARSQALSAGVSGTVNIVADDATGQVWTTLTGVHTVEGTEVLINDGVKVWANGAGSLAVAVITMPGVPAVAATVNGTGTQVWTEGDTGTTIDGGQIANIWNGANVWANGDTSNAIRAITFVTVNGANVWSNGATSNAIVMETLNISGGGKVWAEGAGSSAVAARSRIIANITSADGDGEVWTTVGGVQTVKDGALAYINDGVKVWANGAGSQVVTARIRAEVNSTNTQVWTEGGTSDTVVAPVVNIWNGANVWSSGDTSNTVTATTSVTVNGAKVWSNGATSSAIVTATLNISGGGQVWTTGDSSSTVKGTTVYINDGASVWANGAGSSAIEARSQSGGITVQIDNAIVRADTPGGRAISLEGGSGKTVLDILAETSRFGDLISSGEVRANGAGTSAIVANSGSGDIFINAAIASANGADSPIITANSVSGDIEISFGISIWTDGDNSPAIRAKSARGNITLSGSVGQVWTNAPNSPVIHARADAGDANAIVSTFATVWSEGDNTATIDVAGDENAFINILGYTVTAEVWANGADSSAAKARSGEGNAQVVINFPIDGQGLFWRFFPDYATVWTDGDNGAAILAETDSGTARVDIWYGGTVFTNGADSTAVSVSSSEFGSFVSATLSQNSSIYTEGANSTAVRMSIGGEGAMYMGSSVFTNGANSTAISVSGLTLTAAVSGAKVWTEGADSTAIGINGVNSAILISYSQTDEVPLVTGGVNSTTLISLTQADGVPAVSEIFTKGVNSAAFSAIEGTNIIFISNGVSTFWAEEANSTAVKADVDGYVDFELASAGSKAWVNGSNSSAVSFKNINGSMALTVARDATVCGGVFAGATCTEGGADVYAVRFETADGATASTKITTRSTGGSIVGKISLSETRDVFYNNGTFTGSGTTGGGDDRVENKGTFTLTGDFDMGAGDDTFVNKDGASVTYDSSQILGGTVSTEGDGGGSMRIASASSPSRHSVPDTESSITPSASGDSRFRLSASPPPAPTTGIDFGSGTDHFINNGTITITSAGGFNGLDTITFGENSTLVVSASPGEMNDKPLINLEGEITAEDIKGISIEFDNPARHSAEFAMFSENAIPDGEAERQAILGMIREGLGEGENARMSADGNIFITLVTREHMDYLRNYDAILQSAYYADNAFSEKLRGGCYGGGGAETQDLSGGCVWADTDGRYTRQNADNAKYGEDAYVFSGGFTIPSGKSAISIAAGYETSDFEIGADTNAVAERFMAGIAVAGEIWDGIITDARTQFAKAVWESTAVRSSAFYNAKTDISTWSAAVGAEMPIVPGGVFMVVPRVEAAVTRVSADSFGEKSAGDSAISVDKAGETYLVISPSVKAYAPAGDSVNIWMSLGAEAHITDPETKWSGGSPESTPADPDPVFADGNFERVMVKYGAGLEVTPGSGVSLRVEYGGGVGAGLDTLTQRFSARFGLAF